MVIDIRHCLSELLYPELRRLPKQSHQLALRRAKSEPLDNMEHLAILLAVVATAYLTRFIVADTAGATRTIAILVNFVVAIPLVGVLVSPFLIRRTRRGLRNRLNECQLNERSS